MLMFYTGFAGGYGAIVYTFQGGIFNLIIFVTTYYFQGELLPSDLRSLGCALQGVLENISLFTIVKLVPVLRFPLLSIYIF